MCRYLQPGLQWQLWVDWALLSPFVILYGKGLYIYIYMYLQCMAWICRGSFSARSLFLSHLRSRSLGQGVCLRSDSVTWGIRAPISLWLRGRRSCVVLAALAPCPSWACFRTFMCHMSMWRSWCLSESRDKSVLLLIISDSLFRGWITAVR